MREWCEMIGYKIDGVFLSDCEFILAYCRYLYFCYDGGLVPEYFRSINAIDCKSNAELFKAIAALRDDSDDFQWFVLNNDADVNYTDIHRVPCYHQWFNTNKIKCYELEIPEFYHKATPQELIEHFSK